MVGFGLIGKQLGHSLSADYFADKFINENIDAEYKLYPVEDISILPEFLLSHPHISGLNVTIPYKETVIPFLDELSKEALEIGAVNVIKVIRSEKLNSGYKLIGFNSDWLGFKNSLNPLVSSRIKSALILGTGGASKAVGYALKSMGIKTLFVSRHKNETNSLILTYQELTSQIIKDNLLIVNTTPLGMWPDEDSCPDLPYHFISGEHICYDLVYNPSITRFMKLCAARGATVKNGIEMLHNQAEIAWQIFNDKAIF